MFRVSSAQSLLFVTHRLFLFLFSSRLLLISIPLVFRGVRSRAQLAQSRLRPSSPRFLLADAQTTLFVLKLFHSFKVSLTSLSFSAERYFAA